MKTKLAARLLPFLAPPISGALLVAGFPYYNVWLLPWVALVPMLYALRGRRPIARCLFGYFFGVCFFGILFYWITLVRYPATLGYLAFLFVFPAVFIPWGALTGWALDRGGAAAMLIPALAWAALELLMSYGAFAFPWWSLAVSQTHNLSIVQIASVTGMYGVSFLVVMSNVFVYEVLTRRMARNRIVWICFALALLGAEIFGMKALMKKPVENAKTVRVALIQASFTQEEKLTAIQENINEDLDMMYDTYWNMSADAAKISRPDLIVWPESVLPSFMILDRSLPETQRRVGGFGATLITGVYIESYNSVVGVSPRGQYLGRYDKTQLVPFGEYVPYRDVLGKIPGLGNWLNNKVFESDVERGKRHHLFDVNGNKAGVMICFESQVPHIARSMTRDGANMLLVVTNDAWFRESPSAAQHVALAALRAIENRRPLAQAANAGLSVVIDPYGRVTKASGLFTREYVTGAMQPSSEMTFYTKHGDVFGIACIAALALCVALAMFAEKKETVRGA